MRRRRLNAALALLPAAVPLIGVPRARAQERRVVTLGTATPGGGFPVFGAAFADTVNELDPGLAITPRHTKGSTENVPLLEAGQLDIALVQGEVLHEALTGVGRPPADLRIVAAMYATPGMFVVRAESPFRSFADLRGQPVAMGAAGSGLVLLARYVFGGLGLDPDQEFRTLYLEKAAEGPAMVLDGRAAALWGGGIGWPGFVAVAKSPGGARFIGPSAEEIRRITAKHPFLRPMTIPAGSYPGQTEPVASVGSWSFVMARPGLDDETGYRIARALHRGEAAIAKRLAQASETTLANTVSGAPRAELIHPGVRRYLREIGLLK